MGSHNFENFYASKTATLQEAYKALVDEAIYMDGHDAYSGTIATTDSVTYGSADPQHLYTEQAAAKIISERLDSLHKWDAAEGLRILDISTAKRRTVTKTITLKSSTNEFRYWGEDINAALREQVTLKPGEQIEKWETVRGEDRQEQVTRKYKVTVEATQGKSETRYFIEQQSRHNSNPNKDWNAGHKTQAAARKALTEWLDKQGDGGFWHSGTGDYGIVAETRRETGEPLVLASRKIVQLTAKVQVTIYTLPTKQEQAGWLIYGWAAS